MIYLKLIWSFIQVGLFSIGGGYAAIPLIQEQVVDINKWMTLSEFTNLITIAEMTPGPIAVNCATFVGTRIAGVPGALVSTLACIFPSIIIVSVMAVLYQKFKKSTMLQSILASLRPAVVALILAAALKILIMVLFKSELSAVSLESFNSIYWTGAVLFAAAFFILRKFRLNPILVMCLCGAANLGIGLLLKWFFRLF